MSDPLETFMRECKFQLHLAWWTSLRLADCGELVYRHAIGGCPCGRTQSAAYEAWRAQNPALAAHQDELQRSRR